MLTENSMLLAKIEATYGTDPTPTTAANFIAVYDINVNPNLTYNDTQGQDGSLSARGGTIGQGYIEVSFTHELQVNETTATTPPCDPLLLACGFTDGAADGTYLPYTSYPSGKSSVTLYVYHEDLLWTVTGARGNANFVFQAGQPARIEFTFQGKYQGFSDTTFPTTWTDLGGDPVVAMNQSFDWDSSNHPVVESLSFTLGNTLAVSPTIDDADSYGVDAIEITNRLGEGSFNPVAVKDGTIDFQTHMLATTQTAIDYVVGDGTRTVTISLPKTEIMNITPGDRNGIRIFDIPFRLVRNTGDDEISIAFA